MELYILSIIALAFTVGCAIGGVIMILIHQKKMSKGKVKLSQAYADARTMANAYEESQKLFWQVYNLLPEKLKTKEEDENEND